MGQIFRIRADGQPGSESMALKVVDSPNLTRVDQLRFEREFQLTSQFAHPNLVEVYDFGTYQGTTFYTMEWVMGVDIDTAFEKELASAGGGQLPPPAVGWINGVLSGLQTLHEAGIVHRDLKPDNILIDKNGQAKLLDLGLASHFTDDRSTSRLTVPGAVLGTIHFMAPEQVIGAEVDARSDLYALGVLLYRWFCDRLPFVGPDPISVLGQILHEPVPAIESRLQLPKGVVDLVEQLLSKSPDDRPSSALQVRGIWNRSLGSLSDSAERELVAPSLKALPLPARFVGRESALTKAQDCLLNDNAQGLNVVFTGAPGMGKSRCLTELRDWAKRRRWKVLQTVASPLDTLPFQPLLDPLRSSLKFGIPESLKSFHSELALILPELMTDETEALRGDFNPLRRYRLFEGMRRVLIHDRRRTDEPYVLLTLEDLHYAGDETLEFLHFVKQRQESKGESNLLVAATLGGGQERSELRSGRLEQTLHSPHLLNIGLERLDKASAKALVLSMVGGGALEEISLNALLSQSEGNPLFLIEMTRVFLEEGRLQRFSRDDGDVWKLRLQKLNETSTTSAKIPDTLKSVVSRRLKPLHDEDRRLLKIAAFLGLRFHFPLLATISGRPEPEVFDSLLRLESKGLIKEGKVDNTFDFCNSVIPAVLLDAASPSEKRQTHLQICQSALAQDSEECDPFWLAWHFREAGEEAEALRHLYLSADRALASFSFAQATALYREILASPEIMESLDIKVDSVEEKYADALRFQGELEESSRIYQDLLGRPSATSKAQPIRLLRKLAMVKDAQGETPESFELLKEAWKALGLTPLDEIKGNWNLMSLLKALTSSKLSLGGHSRIPPLDAAQAEEMGSLAVELQRILFFLRPTGWVQQAAEVALTQRKIKVGVENDPFAQAQAHFNGAYLCLRLPKGWQTQTLRLLDNAIEMLKEVPFSFSCIDLKRDCGYLYYLSGRAEHGLELVAEAAEEAENLGHLTNLPSSYGIAAAIATSLADFQASEDFGWKGYHLAQAMENRRDAALTACQLVRSLTYQGKWDEIEPIWQVLEDEDFRCFPYIRIAWLQAQAERAIWEGKPGGFERAATFAKEGLELADQLDELPYHRRSFHLLLHESRLKGTEPENFTREHWAKLESRLRAYPHFRFRAKLLELTWLEKVQDHKAAEILAEKLLQRPECNDYRRNLIESLIRI